MAIDRVLVVDPSAPGARHLAELLHSLRPNLQIRLASDGLQALAIAQKTAPQLIFVEAAGPGLDGVKFVRDLRESNLPCRTATTIMTSATATASLIRAARDAGVSEFLRRPYTIASLLKRINPAVSSP